MRKLSFELLFRVIQETPKVLQIIAIGLWLFPRVESKCLLLKIPFTLDTGLRAPAKTDLSVSFLWTSFHGTRRLHVSIQRMEATNNPT